MAENATVGDRVRDMAYEVGESVVFGLERWLVKSSVVPTTPFLDSGLFEWVPRVDAGWAEMREELDGLLPACAGLPNFQDIAFDVRWLSDDDQWKTFFFFGYGYRSEANCRRCPRTAALLEGIPGLTTAFFSILSPHKHIDGHRGPYRGVLRYHLGLLVPDPQACGINVGGETRHWSEGASMVFDDGYEHFAWNDSDQLRAVLFVDFVRPMRRPAADVNAAVIKAIAWSPFLRDAKRRHEAWEQRFERLMPSTRTPRRSSRDRKRFRHLGPVADGPDDGHANEP